MARVIFQHFVGPFGAVLLAAILLAIVLFAPEQNYMERYFEEMDAFQGWSATVFSSASNEKIAVIEGLSKVYQAAFWLVKDLDLDDPICADEPVQIRIEDLIELKKRVMEVIATTAERSS